ncbi:MAG: 2-oxo acid dehydrogenase subunit E2 [Verrucomicrobia bacterium]|nr:MAG: 2-oxo acid dehydrogenase subunit E2 [Verrucomicrobiota bacterium]
MKKRVPILMPQMGQSVAEGTVVAWKHKTGENVKADEALLEIETDKTNVEVESPATGTLVACLKHDGERAAAGETIGFIEVEITAEEAAKPHGAAPKAEAETVSSQTTFQITNDLPAINRDQFSPYVLRLAMLNGVTMEELEGIRGTGRGARVTKSDLLHYLARRPIVTNGVRAAQGVAEPSAADLAALGKVVPMTSIRRTIADHMVQSIHTSAHVTMVHLVDMTHLVQLRERIKDEFEQRYHARLSYTALVLFVTARVLRDFPSINASVAGANLVLRSEVNIGCAVALSDESLVVPVVHQADKKSFPEIVQELDRLIERARKKELTRADVEGGTFTISNFGAFGSIIGTPIINQPQVAILGMGAIVKSPTVVDNQIVIRDRLYLSFTFDHRVIDGAMGGRFLNAIQKATEKLDEKALNVEAL